MLSKLVNRIEQEIENVKSRRSKRAYFSSQYYDYSRYVSSAEDIAKQLEILGTRPPSIKKISWSEERDKDKFRLYFGKGSNFEWAHSFIQNLPFELIYLEAWIRLESEEESAILSEALLPRLDEFKERLDGLYKEYPNIFEKVPRPCLSIWGIFKKGDPIIHTRNIWGTNRGIQLEMKTHYLENFNTCCEVVEELERKDPQRRCCYINFAEYANSESLEK
jgi:hypothetical protein